MPSRDLMRVSRLICETPTLLIWHVTNLKRNRMTGFSYSQIIQSSSAYRWAIIDSHPQWLPETVTLWYQANLLSQLNLGMVILRKTIFNRQS